MIIAEQIKNQSIDLGGVAKGFATDEIRDILSINNIKSTIIDLGGNIVAIRYVSISKKTIMKN